jgi:alkaline phosphatase D
MDHLFDRRNFVRGAGLGAGALILGGRAVWPDPAATGRRRIPFAKGGRFPEGIASGEPTTRGATIWTRLGGYKGDRRLAVEVARDPGFDRVVLRKELKALARKDHTVKLRVSDKRLKAGEEYYYRFETREKSSPVGRFRTLRPADSREPVRVAFFSCQDWQAGYFGAHRTIADLDDLDLVLCLGDYIYERNFYDGPRKDETGKNKDGEVQTLDEYRQKYRFYRTDADLRAMHAQHAFAAIWDDHEVEDNHAGTLPGDATQDPRVPYLTRRQNAYRAFNEYMPFFDRDAGPDLRIYRTFRLGRTAELILLDQRQYRDDQPCNDELFVPCPEAESEPRKYLGDEQKEWFKTALERSAADWKLVGNQLMIQSLDAPPNNPINKDSWDGYGVERREVLGHVESKGVQNIAFLTGDIHTFFAGEVGTDGRGPESVATEFVGGSITSLGIPETIQSVTGAPLSKEQTEAVTTNIGVTNPHLKYDEQESRGYGVLEATADELKVEFKAVKALERTTEATTIGNFRVASGTPRVEVL